MKIVLDIDTEMIISFIDKFAALFQKPKGEFQTAVVSTKPDVVYSNEQPTEDGLYPTQTSTGVFSGIFFIKDGKIFSYPKREEIHDGIHTDIRSWCWGPKLD
jgi:hypothetical protein